MSFIFKNNCVRRHKTEYKDSLYFFSCSMHHILLSYSLYLFMLNCYYRLRNLSISVYTELTYIFKCFITIMSTFKNLGLVLITMVPLEWKFLNYTLQCCQQLLQKQLEINRIIERDDLCHQPQPRLRWYCWWNCFGGDSYWDVTREYFSQ